MIAVGWKKWIAESAGRQFIDDLQKANPRKVTCLGFGAIRPASETVEHHDFESICQICGQALDEDSFSNTAVSMEEYGKIAGFDLVFDILRGAALNDITNINKPRIRWK
ncbi:hypothetical protein D3C73_754560 [compost metagenome]